LTREGSSPRGHREASHPRVLGVRCRRDRLIPALRAPAGLKTPVTIDEILDALGELDGRPRPPGGKPFRLRSAERTLAA
jgi:hypothetical protein